MCNDIITHPRPKMLNMIRKSRPIKTRHPTLWTGCGSVLSKKLSTSEKRVWVKRIPISPGMHDHNDIQMTVANLVLPQNSNSLDDLLDYYKHVTKQNAPRTIKGLIRWYRRQMENFSTIWDCICFASDQLNKLASIILAAQTQPLFVYLSSDPRITISDSTNVANGIIKACVDRSVDMGPNRRRYFVTFKVSTKHVSMQSEGRGYTNNSYCENPDGIINNDVVLAKLLTICP